MIQTYAALASPSAGHSTDLRHQLLANLRGLYAHPYWGQPGRPHADLVELRRQARAHLWASPA